MPKSKAVIRPRRAARSLMSNRLWFLPVRTPDMPGAEHRPRRRRLVSGIAAGAVLVASAAGSQAAAPGILHLRCTNPTSGASWTVVVDLDHGQVDSLAAAISDKWISWRDPKQGFFDFDRATGKLQLRNASSTGGYFLYYTCQPE
jgi:hypothetical protein